MEVLLKYFHKHGPLLLERLHNKIDIDLLYSMFILFVKRISIEKWEKQCDLSVFPFRLLAQLLDLLVLMSQKGAAYIYTSTSTLDWDRINSLMYMSHDRENAASSLDLNEKIYIDLEKYNKEEQREIVKRVNLYGKTQETALTMLLADLEQLKRDHHDLQLQSQEQQHESISINSGDIENTINPTESVLQSYLKFLYPSSQRLLSELHGKIDTELLYSTFILFVESTPVPEWTTLSDLSVFPVPSLIKIIDKLKNLYDPNIGWDDKIYIDFEKYNAKEQCDIVKHLYISYNQRPLDKLENVFFQTWYKHVDRHLQSEKNRMDAYATVEEKSDEKMNIECDKYVEEKETNPNENDINQNIMYPFLSFFLASWLPLFFLNTKMIQFVEILVQMFQQQTELFCWKVDARQMFKHFEIDMLKEITQKIQLKSADKIILQWLKLWSNDQLISVYDQDPEKSKSWTEYVNIQTQEQQQAKRVQNAHSPQHKTKDATQPESIETHL